MPADQLTEALDGIDAAAAPPPAAAPSPVPESSARLRNSGGALPPAAQPQLPAGPSSSPPSAAAAGRRMVQVSPQTALQLVRAGRHPLELQGIEHLLPRLQSALSSLLATSHRSFAAATSWSGEAVPREKAPQAAVLGWVLRLLPLLGPEGWGGAPLGLLPGYTAHAEGQLRACALDALQAVMRSAPALRGDVLVSMAKFLSTIPDEAVQVGSIMCAAPAMHLV